MANKVGDIMCKIAAVAGIKKKKIEETWSFLELLATNMSTYNSDGLGYAAIDREGKMFGEKWLINKNAFRDPYSTKTMKRIWDDLVGRVSMLETYSFFGEKVNRPDASAVILHARAATIGNLCIDNTHPFFDDPANPRMAFIHNGGIRNHQFLTKKYSQCDSETILWQYIKEDVQKNPHNIQQVADALSGWYAGALLNNKTEKPYLDIFTDGTSLHVSYIEELGVFVYSTSHSDLLEVAGMLDYNPSLVAKVEEGSLIRLEAATGKVIQQLEFSPDFVTPTASRFHPNVIDISSTAGKLPEEIAQDMISPDDEAPTEEGFTEDDIKALMHNYSKIR